MNMEKSGLWEMYTPHGIYTLMGTFQEVTVASIMLGQGEYKLKEAFGQRHVPMLSEGNYEFWALEHFNMSLDDLIKKTEKHKLSETLNSVIKADKHERLFYEEEIKSKISDKERKIYKENWNNENDSGIHCITEQAWLMANYLVPKKSFKEMLN